MVLLSSSWPLLSCLGSLSISSCCCSQFSRHLVYFFKLLLLLIIIIIVIVIIIIIIILICFNLSIYIYFLFIFLPVPLASQLEGAQHIVGVYASLLGSLRSV